MTTLQETIVGGVIVLLFGYFGNLFHTYYIKKKIEGTPNFWTNAGLNLLLIILFLVPIGIIVYTYITQPLNKAFVVIIATQMATLVFMALNYMFSRRMVRMRKESTEFSAELYVKSMKLLKDSLGKDQDENNQM